PIVNTDIAITSGENPVILQSLDNDAAGSTSGVLNPASVTIVTPPANGSATVDPVTGHITYTANPGFSGNDTLTYQVCDETVPTALCGLAQQIITVEAPGAPNTVLAADDFNYFPMNTTGTGNLLSNDTDPEGGNLVVTAQNLVIAGKGTIQINTDGTYQFTPE